MFDLGWSEFLIIGFVLMMVVGPKDLPKVLRTFSKFSSQARSMAREFTSSLEEASKDANMGDVKQIVSDIKTGKFEDMADMIDDDMKSELNDLKDSTGLSEVSDEIKSLQFDAKAAAETSSDDADTKRT